VKCLLLLLAAAGLAEAQIGYPLPGQYPYPGGPVPGTGYPYPGSRIPGTSTTPNGGTANQPLPSFRGTLKHIDSKSLTVEMDDYRVLDFRITSKTKYFKDNQEVKPSQFNAGDTVTVEGPYDKAGELTAVNVYWQKAAAAPGTASKDKDADKDNGGAVDTWKDKPAERATEAAPPPPPPDPNDPGPPTLKRGKPVERATTPAGPEPGPTAAPATAAPANTAQAKAVPQLKGEAPQQVAVNLPPNTVPLPPSTVSLPPSTAQQSPPPSAPSSPNLVNLPPATVSLPRPTPRDEREDTAIAPPDDTEPSLDRVPLGIGSEDPLIRKASEAALQFTETLPNYVVKEVVSRYESDSRPVSWHALDVVTTDVIYENGKEDYRNIAINGKPATKNLEETGAWSTGEFGTLLIDLFSPATAADFIPNGEARIAGIDAKMYSFSVKRENSHWNLHFGSQTYVPAYKGTTWIDPKTARVLRIEMQALGLPTGFPTDHVESATDYQYVRLGSAQQFLLPVHSDNLSCQRDSSFCSKNAIDFRNYHKYEGESTIQFGDVAPNGSPAPSAPPK
jgi:hypothetical protein